MPNEYVSISISISISIKSSPIDIPQYPLPQQLFKPESNPQYYNNILREVSEAPDRTRPQALWLWLKGKIQFR